MLNCLGQLRALGFELIVGAKMLQILLAVVFKNCLFIGCLIVYFHKVLNRIEVVVHRDAGRHYFILLSSNLVKLVEAGLDRNDCSVGTQVTTTLLLRNESCDFLSRLREERKSL